MKTERELLDYVWAIYPDKGSKEQKELNQNSRIVALDAYKFISGKHDEDEKIRKKIAASIYNKIMSENK